MALETQQEFEALKAALHARGNNDLIFTYVFNNSSLLKFPFVQFGTRGRLTKDHLTINYISQT